jgi:peptidoglycan/xylan/chitin deacetylase (PgdA/CDA1 family)
MSKIKSGPSSYLLTQPIRGVGKGWLTPLRKNKLTVICYHRVHNPEQTGFSGFAPTISASRDVFIRQIDYLKAHYNPISLSDLVAWMHNSHPLPPCPVLVTFDDGYRDNAEIAWPIMRERGVPALIFLATEYIGADRPFAWDFAAYCFHSTRMHDATVPLVGQARLSTEADRDSASVAWVESLKALPGAARAQAMEELASALHVSPPPQNTFRRLHLDWSDVHELSRQGVEFGAHTCTHPILTQMPSEESAAEIVQSIDTISERLGVKPLAFAYPNGSLKDFSSAHENIVRKAGVPLAFSLEPGPIPLPHIHQTRMRVPRVYIGLNDNMPRFIAKLNGGARLTHFLRRSRTGRALFPA